MYRNVKQIAVCITHVLGAKRPLQLFDHWFELFTAYGCPSDDRSQKLAASRCAAPPI